MNEHAIPRKPRTHPAIMSSKQAFSDAIRQRNHNLAAKIVFDTAIEVLGVEGLMEGLDRGNQFWIRKQKREEIE